MIAKSGCHKSDFNIILFLETMTSRPWMTYFKGSPYARFKLRERDYLSIIFGTPSFITVTFRVHHSVSNQWRLDCVQSLFWVHLRARSSNAKRDSLVWCPSYLSKSGTALGGVDALFVWNNPLCNGCEVRIKFLKWVGPEYESFINCRPFWSFGLRRNRVTIFFCVLVIWMADIK